MSARQDPNEQDEETAELRRIVLTAAGVGDLHRGVGELVAEVKGLRGDLRTRPDLDEVEDRVKAVTQDLRSVEGRLNARRRHLAVALVLGLAIYTPVAAYVAINVHEVYRDACDTAPTIQGENRPDWCDGVFLFDRNGAPAEQPHH